MNKWLLAWLACSLTPALAVDPMRPIVEAVSRDFGVATTRSVRLLKSELSAQAPVSWALFANDPYRPADLVKLKLDRTGTGNPPGWRAQALGSGQLLQRVPPLPINWALVQQGPVEVRRKALQTAALAKTPISHIAYQLTTNPTSKRPEWGLVLTDSKLTEVGFLIIAADNGAVIHQDFQRSLAPPTRPPGLRRPPSAAEEGEQAARRVKDGARQAWDWTERAGRRTGGFFRELFKPRR